MNEERTDHTMDIPEEEFEEEIQEVQKGFEEEEAKWAALGLDHPSSGYRPDLFLMANGFDALKNLLIDKGIVGDRELTLALRKLMLTNMKILREEIEPQIIEARRNAIAVRNMPPDLDNGQGRLPFEKH
jgi:hypothetical protein